MNETKKITQAILYAQTSEGTLQGAMALTKQATYTFQGRSLTNRVYLATGKGPWNMKSAYKPVRNGTGNAFVRVTGVVSGCEVTTSSSTNNVEVAAGVANVNGTRVVVGADTSNAITRGANAKYAVTAVHVNAAGTLAVTKGTDGDSVDLTGGYGGAGQKPLVAVTECVLAYVVTYDDEAAVIPNSDIYAGDSANIDYHIDPVRGGIVVHTALELNRTGGIPRTIYASFYDLTTAYAAVGKLEDVNITIRKAKPVPTPNHDTFWDEHVSVPGCGWSVTVKRWRPDTFWLTKMMDPLQDTFYLKLYEDVDDTSYLHGFATLDADFNVHPVRGPVSDELGFTGNGELVAASV